MNKETILDCFFKDREELGFMQLLCEKYYTYMTTKVLQPANFERNATMVSRNSERIGDASSISNTLSLCSAFSRMTIDKTVYIDIMTNRKKHNIFLDLETEDPDEKKWHYMDDKDNIYGPMSTRQMNDYFQLFKFNEDYRVKKIYDNDDYVPLKLIIKRYYKKILSENLNIDKGKLRPLSKKTQEFKRGNKIALHKQNHKENYKSEGRVQRVLSHEVKPNLYFLDDIVEEFDEDDDMPNTRIRSLTTATK